MVIASGVALLALYMGPILVTEYIAKLGVSDSHAGFIMSTEMAGFTAGAALFFVVAGFNWRGIVIAALCIMVLGNVLCSFTDSLTLFTGSRFVSGLGAGLLMTMTIQVIGIMHDPDRVYGMWTAGQLSFGALGILVFPPVIAASGIDTVFLIWALLAAGLFLSVRFYPQGRHLADTGAGDIVKDRRFILGIAGLAGLFFYYGGQAGVWVYIEQLGLSWGLQREYTGHILFTSIVAGIGGGVVAIVLGDKIGRAIPLSTSMFCSCIAIFLLMNSGSAGLFAVAACLFNFGWYLFLPYISAIIAAVDRNGSLLTGLAVAFPAGLATGPAVAAMLIGNAESLMPALIYGLVSVPLGLTLMLPAARFESTGFQLSRE